MLVKINDFLSLSALDFSEVMTTTSGLRKATKLTISVCDGIEILGFDTPWLTCAKKTTKAWKIGLDGRNVFEQIKNFKNGFLRAGKVMKVNFVSICGANICQTVKLIGFLKIPVPLLSQLAQTTGQLNIFRLAVTVSVCTMQNSLVVVSSGCVLLDIVLRQGDEILSQMVHLKTAIVNVVSLGRVALSEKDGGFEPMFSRHYVQSYLKCIENIGKVAVITLSGGLGIGRLRGKVPWIVALSFALSLVSIIRYIHKIHPGVKGRR